jgi:hypothetical protein
MSDAPSLDTRREMMRQLWDMALAVPTPSPDTPQTARRSTDDGVDDDRENEAA